MSATRIVALALTVLGVPTSTASAAPSWSPTTVLSPAPSTTAGALIGPALAATPEGELSAAWNENSGGPVFAAAPSAPQAWATTSFGPQPAALSALTSIASDAAGNAMAIYVGTITSGANVTAERALYSTRAAGSTSWSAPAPVFPDADYDGGSVNDYAYSCDVEANAAGTFAVGCTRNDSTSNPDPLPARLRLWQSSSRTWSAAEDLPGSTPILMSLAVEKTGAVDVAWSEGPDLPSSTSSVTTRSPDGTWGAAHLLGAGALAKLAVNDRGDVVATWIELSGQLALGTAVRRAGTWTSTGDVLNCAFFTNLGLPAVAINAAGDIAVGWTCNGIFAATTRKAAGAWTTEQPLQLGTAFGGSRILPSAGLTLDVDGLATAVWLESAANLSNDFTGASASQRADGSWDTAIPLWPVTTSPSGLGVTTDASGSSIVGWILPTGEVDVRVRDLRGPELTGISVPATAAAGAQVAFAASAKDTWSTTGPITWTFGDGASATGSATTHAFASPGTYTVAVRSTDGNGNESSVKRSIVVSSTNVSAAPTSCTGTVGPGRTVTATCTLSAAASPALDSNGVLRTRKRGGKKLILGRRLSSAHATSKGKTLTFTFITKKRMIKGTYRVSIDSTQLGRKAFAVLELKLG